MIAAVDCKPLKNVVQERLVSDSSTAPVHTFQVAGVSWFIAKRKCWVTGAAPRPCCLLLPRAESASRNAIPIRRPSKASHSPCVTACIYATICPVPREQRLLAASRMCAMCTCEVTNWLENVEESARHPHPQQRALNGSKERRETLRSA